MQRIVFIALMLAGLQFLSGCGGSNSNTGTHAFVVNNTGGTIDTFNIKGDGTLSNSTSFNVGSNALNMVLVGAGSGASSGVVNFAYVISQNQSAINVYNVDKSGVITSANTSATDNNLPTFLVANGGFLYAADSGVQGSPGISVYSINTTNGALTFVGSTTLSLAPGFLAVSGGFLYATIPLAGTIEAFTITSNGTVSELAAALGPVVNAGTRPIALTVSGSFLIAADFLGNNIYVFEVQSGQGNLLTVAGSPFTVNAAPAAIAVDGSSHVYVASENANTISVYNISPTGQLSQITGSPITTKGSSPAALAFSPQGNALYVANNSSSNVDEFQLSTVNNNLTLTALTGSPVGAGGGPIWITVK